MHMYLMGSQGTPGTWSGFYRCSAFVVCYQGLPLVAGCCVYRNEHPAASGTETEIQKFTNRKDDDPVKWAASTPGFFVKYSTAGSSFEKETLGPRVSSFGKKKCSRQKFFVVRSQARKKGKECFLHELLIQEARARHYHETGEELENPPLSDNDDSEPPRNRKPRH